MALQELLGEALAGFQLRRRLARTENPPAATVELVHYAEGERQLGPNYGKVRLELCRDRNQRWQAFDIRSNAFSFFADAAVSRCAINVCDARRLAQFPDQGMLAPATSDH